MAAWYGTIVVTWLNSLFLNYKRAARIILNADRKTCQQPVRQQYSMPLSPRNVYNFQNCQVTFNTAGNNCTQASSTSAQTKRPLKRCILYSDSD